MDHECELCGRKLVPWMTMPIDCRKESPCAYGHLHRCPRCAFGMALPRPPAEEIADFYALDAYYTHGESHFASPGRVGFLDRARVHLAWRFDFGVEITPDLVHRLLGERASAICDIGCGAGALSLGLAERGHEVIGVDVDPEAVRTAQAAGVGAHLGSVEQLPPAVAERQFDLIVMSHVLEHVLHPSHAVAQVAARLRPGGRFICVVPNNDSVALRYTGIAWDSLDVPRHLNFFVPANLRTICEQAGLEVRRLMFAGYCRHYANEWINTERRTYDAIARIAPASTSGLRKNSKARAWRMLARTALATKRRKYDQVGVLASKPTAPSDG